MALKNKIMDEIVSILKKIINNDLNDIAPDENLFNLGLNSLTCIQMVVQLETVFEVSFDEDELTFDSFNTAEKITEKVVSKLMYRNQGGD